jgi:hypothetical protein
VDYLPRRSNNSKFPEPAPEPEEIDEAAHDASIDVVLNVFKEKRGGQSIALRIIFRLPEQG